MKPMGLLMNWLHGLVKMLYIHIYNMLGIKFKHE
jgi:hypothetical protein